MTSLKTTAQKGRLDPKKKKKDHAWNSPLELSCGSSQQGEMTDSVVCQSNDIGLSKWYAIRLIFCCIRDFR